MDSDAPVPSLPPEPSPRPPRTNWLLLLACLLAPAVLTCLTVLMDPSSNSPAPGVSILGGALGGIGCGILCSRRFDRTTGMKVLLGVILAIVCGLASITLATVGCLASGYQLNFH